MSRLDTRPKQQPRLTPEREQEIRVLVDARKCSVWTMQRVADDLLAELDAMRAELVASRTEVGEAMLVVESQDLHLSAANERIRALETALRWVLDLLDGTELSGGQMVALTGIQALLAQGGVREGGGDRR